MGMIPRMGRNDRRLLARLGRRSGDPATALRFLAVARLAAGGGSTQVAAALEVARSTVVRAAHRFLLSGPAGLYDRRCGNGHRKAGIRFHHRVAELLRRSPQDFGWMRPSWTRELLSLQMARDGWPRVAVCTMGRVLAQVGARLGSPRPVVLCPWPRDARLHRLQEIRALEEGTTAREPVLYSDEVDLNLNPRIGRDWMLRGTQRRILTPGKNQKFYLAGALDVRTGALHTTGGPQKNAALFCELLTLLAAKYPNAKRIHLVVDNYAIHSARATLHRLAELNDRIILHFLPPYCPDANRIERVWQDLHANVTRNHRCRTMKQLLANARRYLQAYTWRQVTGTAAALAAAA